MTCLPDIKMVNQMAENIFQKWKRASPLIKDLGWAGFAKYWATSQPVTSQTPVVGPTEAEVLASDQRIRRRMAGQMPRVPRGISQTGLPARLTMPTLIGF